MKFDINKIKEGTIKDDGIDTTSTNDIASKRKRLIQAVKDHVQWNINQEPIMERKAKKDEDGKILLDEDGKQQYHSVQKSRVTKMSKPTSVSGEVVCELKYGNKASIDIFGKKGIKIPKEMEENMWKAVIKQIEDGDLDKEIEKAAIEATPNVTKKK